jgi:hypothetical protein
VDELGRSLGRGEKSVERVLDEPGVLSEEGLYGIKS